MSDTVIACHGGTVAHLLAIGYIPVRAVNRDNTRIVIHAKILTAVIDKNDLDLPHRLP
jgi:hypothetical protein